MIALKNWSCLASSGTLPLITIRYIDYDDDSDDNQCDDDDDDEKEG